MDVAPDELQRGLLMVLVDGHGEGVKPFEGQGARLGAHTKRGRVGVRRLVCDERPGFRADADTHAEEPGLLPMAS
jgi:hypothetical protein